jgi:hypothetical protein
MRYFMKVLLGVDQFANTIIGGSPDETISARAGRRSGCPDRVSKLWWTPLAKVLNSVQRGHTDKAILHEEDGSQQDKAYSSVYDPDDIEIVIKDSDCD